MIGNTAFEDLSQALDYIRTSTGLTLTRLSERYIAIGNAPRLSGQLCVRLRDAESGVPVPFALITTENAYMETDSTGSVKLTDVSLPMKLIISHISYQPLEIVIEAPDDTDCHTIDMKPAFALLDEILIPDYFITGLDRLNGGRLSFQAEELPVLPGLSEPDIFFSMQALPGIQSASESVSDINIRGGRNDQNLVLWNDLRMYQTGHFFGLISLFNPYFTNIVTVTKSGTGSRHGRGVSGVIDLRTEDRVISKFEAEAGINLLGGDIVGKVPLHDKLSFAFTARRSLSDLVVSPTYKRYFNRAFRNTALDNLGQDDQLLISNEKFGFSDLSGVLNGKIAKQTTWQLSYLQSANSLTHLERETISGVVEERESSLDQDSRGTGLSFRYSMQDGVNISGNAGYSGYRQRAVNQDIINDQRLVQSNKVNDLQAGIEVQFPLNEQVDMRSGYQFNHIAVSNSENLDRPAFEQLVRDVVTSQVIYSDWELRSANERFYLRPGVRATFYEEYKDSYIEPRLSMNYAISDDLKIEITGEQKHQVMSQVIDLQTDFLGVIKNRWVAASDSLGIPIMQSSQVSGGIIYDKDKFMFSADVFYKEIDGIITSAEGFRNQFEFIRATGVQKVTGGELLINKNFGSLSGWVSYAVMINQNEFSTIFPGVFPSNREIYHQMTLGAGYRTGQFELSGSINYRTGTPFTEPLIAAPVAGGEISYNDPNSSQLGAYLRMDLSARYEFRVSDKLKALTGLSVWNFTGSENILDTYYRLDNGNIREIKGFALRFTPNAFFRLYF